MSEGKIGTDGIVSSEIKNEEYDLAVKKGRDKVKKIVDEDSAHYFDQKSDEKLNSVVSDIIANPEQVSNDLDGTLSKLREPFDQLMGISSVFRGISAKYAITLGGAFLIVNSACKQNKVSFQKLVEKQGFAYSTISRYITVAKQENIQEYSFYGVERIMILINARIRSGYHGNFEDFQNEFNITFNPYVDQKESITDFRIDVATAVMGYFNSKFKWNISDDILTKYVKKKEGRIEYKNVKNIVENSKKGGGTPQQFFDNEIIGVIDPNLLDEQIAKVVNKINNLREAIAVLRTNEDAFSMIGPSTIRSLVEELNSLENGVKATPIA